MTLNLREADHFLSGAWQRVRIARQYRTIGAESAAPSAGKKKRAEAAKAEATPEGRYAPANHHINYAANSYPWLKG